MRKVFGKLMWTAALAWMLPFGVKAQQMPAVPTDPQVRIGKLENGLTYYLRHNEYPKGQADFYIVQKVGAVQENDNQRGLAHFLEHMCFNGTEHFPGNGVIEWLETVGVKFGYNLNASTGLDKTIYKISNAPTERIGVQDSCLLILSDWANGLLLDEEEIDKERKVIHEEWRSQMPPQNRMLERLLPTIMPGSRYAYRMPIGTMEVVDNFPYQLLKDYYKAWYRPDLQGIVVVGDVDVDRIEGKIKELFAGIQVPADAPKWERYPVADNDATIIGIEKDKEQPNSLVQMYFKYDDMPEEQKNSVGFLITKYALQMIEYMMTYRLNELGMNPDAPFAVAQGLNNNFVVDAKPAYIMAGVPKESIPTTLAALYREALRAKRHGFTATEYARMRSEYLSALEKNYKNRGQQQNAALVQECIDHFLKGEPLPGIEQEYQLMNMLVNQIPVETINQLYGQIVTDKNKVVMCMLTEKEGAVYPTEEELLQAMVAVEAEDIAPYVDNVQSEPLVSELPAPGKVVEEQALPLYEATEWTLSNGAKVIVKPTDFKEDEVCVSIVARGGTSVYGEEDAANLICLPYMLQQYELGNYTYADLAKYMAGKQAQINFSLGDYSLRVNGTSTPKDLPSLMELIYMAFTNLNMSADSFAAFQNMYVGALQNQEANPQYVFSKQVQQTFFESANKQLPLAATFTQANRERMLQIMHELLGNAADYTFVFTGNFQPEVLKALVEQYIATLPGDAAKRRDVKIERKLEIKSGSGDDRTALKMEVPQDYVAVMITGKMPYTAKNKLAADFAAQIMTTRLLAEVREKEGATYSIQTQGGMDRLNEVNVEFLTQFMTNSDKLEKALEIIRHEFEGIAKEVSEEEFLKIKEFMEKQYTESSRQNNSWSTAMGSYVLRAEDTFAQALSVIEKLTPKDVSDFMNEVMKQGNYRVVVLEPEL